jgi:hypothetical protein
MRSRFTPIAVATQPNQLQLREVPSRNQQDARQRYAQPEGKYPSTLPEDVSLKSVKLPSENARQQQQDY